MMNKLLRELDHGAMSGDLSCWSCIGYWVLTPTLVFGCNKECCRGPGTKLGLVFGLTWRKTQLVTGHRTLGVFQHQDYFQSKINGSINSDILYSRLFYPSYYIYHLFIWFKNHLRFSIAFAKLSSNLSWIMAACIPKFKG